jgi:hypothetical protein
MTTEERIDTEEQFHERLREIAVAASANGVDIGGGWPILTDDIDVLDWDVEIIALTEAD